MYVFIFYPHIRVYLVSLALYLNKYIIIGMYLFFYFLLFILEFHFSDGLIDNFLNEEAVFPRQRLSMLRSETQLQKLMNAKRYI